MVLAAAARVYNEVVKGNNYSFKAQSPSNTINVMRIVLPSKPTSVTAALTSKENITLTKNQWDENTNTLLIGFENFSEGVMVDIHW